jgi:hypothetical protein
VGAGSEGRFVFDGLERGSEYRLRCMLQHEFDHLAGKVGRHERRLEDTSSDLEFETLLTPRFFFSHQLRNSCHCSHGGFHGSRHSRQPPSRRPDFPPLRYARQTRWRESLPGLSAKFPRFHGFMCRCRRHSRQLGVPLQSDGYLPSAPDSRGKGVSARSPGGRAQHGL